MVPVRCVVEPDPAVFAEHVRPFLLAHRLGCNVILTVLQNLEPAAPPPVCAYACDPDGEPCGVVLRTPPWRALLSPMPPEAVAALEEALAAVDPDAPGVHGPPAEAALFAELRAARGGGRRVRPGMAQRLYVLGDLAPPAGVPGAARRVGEPDVPMVARWWGDFGAEAVPGSPRADLDQVVRRRMRAGAVELWEVDGEPTALGGWVGPVAGLARIGPVYTPRRHRRHGYGSAVTAACAADALRCGADTVLLYADLSNPTSNSIYQRIGFRPVADALEFHLDPVTR
jgi:ribosomal protein S18 acetylase RimI-like enzyme